MDASASEFVSTDQIIDASTMGTFRAALRSAKNIIVVAGAGLSAASGIPTFRDGGGIWRSLDAMSLATPYAFEENPSLVWQFYHYRRIKALEALPNPAHRVLAKLCIPDKLKLVAPSAQSFHLITQNVDGLSIQALREVSAELGLPFSPPDPNNPTSIFEMHGRLFDIKCTKCDYCKEDRSRPLCPALGRADDSFKDIRDAGTRPMDIPEKELPRCPACGSLARPGIVWFYEIPLYLDQIQDLVEDADMCLVIGTSSTVYPAAGYASIVQNNGGKVAVFNLDPDADVRLSDWVFAGGCESVLPSLFPELA